MVGVVELLIPLVAILALFLGLPWLILHYRWKHRAEAQAATESATRVSSDLVQIADRLERRLSAVETILDAEAPNWRSTADREKH